jgi:hypothetical protein
VAYTYKSEGGHGQPTVVATCPDHGRDLCIHPSRKKAELVAATHDRLFHSDVIWHGYVSL